MEHLTEVIFVQSRSRLLELLFNNATVFIIVTIRRIITRLDFDYRGYEEE